jgi:arginyl-tRNA synthetase
MNVLRHLRAGFAAAAPPGADPDAFAGSVRACADPRFGDYQAGGCLPLARALRADPRALARAVAGAVDLEPLADPPEPAGPGFLNVRLRDDWMARTLAALLADDRLGVPAGAPLPALDPEKSRAAVDDPGAEPLQVIARVETLLHEGDVTPQAVRPEISLVHPAERALGLHLLRLPETVESAAGDRGPGVLAGYVLDLAVAAHGFLDECLVLKAHSADRRNSRLALCFLADRALKFGLDLLGIERAAASPGP